MPKTNPKTRMTAGPKRYTAGVIVVLFLGLVFFALIGLLIFTSARHPKNAPLRSETLTVLPPRIRIRTEPNAKAPVVVTATVGERLMLLEDRGVWARVQDPDGLAGWAERGLLERTAEREQRLTRFAAIRRLPPLQGVATQRTMLYSGPGIFYPIVGGLGDGSAVKVFTRDHDFYAIDFTAEVAYADVDAIAVTAAGAPQLEVATTPTVPPPTETTASAAPPPETLTTPPPETPPPAAVPAPVPASADQSGVYAAVPPGGTQPEEMERVIPRYPPAARAAGVAGAVVIRGIVRKDGRIDDVEIIRDLPYGLGDAARDAVERWRFHPATFRGEPIDVYYTVTVNFRMR